MTKDVITRLKRKEIAVPGFENSVSTEVSKQWLVWPQGVKFAADLDSVLQSVREGVVASLITDATIDYQISRTWAAIVKERSGKFYAALDDQPDPEQNLIVGRAQEGHYEHIKKGQWRLAKTDSYVRQLFKRADKDDRIVEVAEGHLELSTKDVFGTSDFAGNRKAKAIFGDITQLCGELLDSHGYSKALFYEAQPKQLDESGLDFDHAEIRGVGMNLDRAKKVLYIVANYPLYFNGYVRGTKNPPEFTK